MPGRPTRPAQHLIAKRRQDAIQMRLAGVDYLTIGKQLAADPRLNPAGTPYPAGYGIDAYQAGRVPPDDDKLADLVKQDLHRVLRQRRGKIAEGADQLRELQDERLERLLYGVWQAALRGDKDAASTALRILERQSKLWGLDRPAQLEVTGADGGPLQVQAVTEEDREGAVLSILSFRDDRAEAAAALEEAMGPGDTDAGPSPAGVSA